MFSLNRKKTVMSILLLWVACWCNLAHSEALRLEVDGEELLGEKVLADKAIARLLWLPSEYGVLPQEKAVAKQMAQIGVESWFVDFYGAMFLSPTSSAVDNIPDNWNSALIDLARQDGVPLWIVAPNKAAQLAVRGLQRLPEKTVDKLGLIMINPNLYTETPSPGLAAEYWPQTDNINLPVTVIQAELSPWKWRLPELSKRLSKSGSDVFTQVLPQVRDRFYFRADAMLVEQQLAQQLPELLQQAMRLQLPYMAENRTFKSQPIIAQSKPSAKKSVQLAVYKGQQGLNLQLKDMFGQQLDLQDYQGKVVLVNFWASWCPPCVHEMPSMSQLKSHYQQQEFEILAVNLGEQKQQVQQFLEKHPVNFPVLLDTAATAVQAWQVFAYPSSYLIDKQGQIRFALFGGTEWDAPHHLEIIDQLLQEP